MNFNARCDIMNRRLLVIGAFFTILTTISLVYVSAPTLRPPPVQPLSQYGVVRLQQSFHFAAGATSFFVYVNSSLGPIYLEQLQLAFDTPQSNPVTLQGVDVDGTPGNGPPCTGTVVSASGTYGDVMPKCQTSAKVTDPVGNLALAAAAGDSTRPGFALTNSIDFTLVSAGFSGTIYVIATVAAPSKAVVTLNIST